MMRAVHYLTFAAWFAGAVDAGAATMAYGGEITKVDAAAANDKTGLGRFSVEIDYYDYCSRGSFGKESTVGAEAQQRVMKLGTVCVLNGELMNAPHFAAALAPGQWGYFYEDTWQNVYTTPNFTWGEVISHDAAKQTVTLRVHRTHKEIHLAKNPPVEEVISYAGAGVQLEHENAPPGEAFELGNWVQVHPERATIVDMRTAASKWSRSEWVPQAEGKRGFANDLSGPALIKAVRADDADKVIDNRVQIDVQREGKLETIDCRSTTFVLDGKLCPPTIAARADREAVLCYYRKDKAPHKIFLRSLVEGNRAELPGGDLPPVEGEATWLLDGQPSDRGSVESATGRVTVFPQRGRTFIAFRPYEVPAVSKKK